MNESLPLSISIVFIFALLIGSFLNVIIHRLPIMMEREWRNQADNLQNTPPKKDLPEGRFDLTMPRSRCPYCDQLITVLQNIPLISYLFLKGRCANCKKPISFHYPLVELITASLTAITVWHFGNNIEALMAVMLTLALITIAMIDAETQLIPDSIVLPLLWVGLSMSLFHPLSTTKMLFISPSDAIIGSLAGYLILWSVFWLFKLISGKDGIGYGDFKLLAALGAWLGWQQIPIIIMMSAALGIVINIFLVVFKGKDKNIPIPFGPYIATSGWIAMLWGETIKNSYINLMF
ncbi:MAG: A24 family peptidase [Woeseiaceae bacterium]|jgi:leader peptidase (prepilin peptidase)/N-methyltransferase|nr:A24 family peptidase [Woeseiaceae bacterium]